MPGFDPNEPRDDHGRWTTGGAPNYIQEKMDQQIHENNVAMLKAKVDLNKVDELMRKAAEVAPEIDAITKQIGANHEGYVVDVNLKSKNRIIEKAALEYNGEVDGNLTIKDSVRSAIVAPRDKIQGIVNDIRDKFPGHRIKLQHTELGYTGYLINIQTRNGIQAEIQVNTPEMMYAKEPTAEVFIGPKNMERIRREKNLPAGLGHGYYEEYRS